MSVDILDVLSAFWDTLPLRLHVQSWRYEIPSCSRDSCSDAFAKVKLVLRCRIEESFRRPLKIGTAESCENAYNVDYEVHLLSAESEFDRLNRDVAARGRFDNVHGFLNYSPPSASASGDAKRGKVQGVAYLKQGLVAEMANILTCTPAQLMTIELEIKAAKHPAEHLVLFKHESHSYEWAGDKPISIADLSVIAESRAPETPNSLNEVDNEDLGSKKSALIRTKLKRVVAVPIVMTILPSVFEDLLSSFGYSTGDRLLIHLMHDGGYFEWLLASSVVWAALVFARDQ